MQAMSEKNKTVTKKSRPRPLSPHLQVYRWLITSTLSILHRLTGVVLSLGLLMVAGWLLLVAYAPEIYGEISELFRTPVGMAILGGWSLALFYHLCNGIRHLFWDMGKGFELKNVTRSGYAVLLSAVSLTALTWYYALQVVPAIQPAMPCH